MIDSPSLKTRSNLNFEDFLKNISQEDPIGPSLRYDALYDDIRLARQEDDPRLSMGIWKTDLKRADWHKIETLCIEALTTKSKDLQIAGWLTEAWISLDGVEGYTCGIQLFSGLINTFWQAIHPKPDEDGDMESRLMIFEWMYRTFSSRLLLAPLTQSKFDETTFGLGFLKSAQYNDASQRRAEKTSKSPHASHDPSKAIGATEEFQRSLEQTPDTYLLTQQQNIANGLQATQILKEALSTLLGANSPSFSQMLGTLREMERILKITLQTREPTPPLEGTEPETINSGIPPEASAADLPPPLSGQEIPVGTLTLKSRHDAYRQLEIIAGFLDQSDPHSLAPQFLRQLVRWENQNILDIFDEIAKTPQEYDILMKVLGAPVSQK
jgi:type VI secretion system protein ImpA